MKRAIKQFIIRVFCAFILDKSKRKVIRNILLNKQVNTATSTIFEIDMILSDFVKAQCLLDNIKIKKDNAKTIILGSSHAQMSYIDDEESINFGNGSQDLYYSWKIYEKFSFMLPKLKNIIVFYDVFSPGNDMQKGPFHSRTSLYNFLFDIPYKSEEAALRLSTFDLEKVLEKKYLPVAKSLSEVIDHSYPVLCAPSPKYSKDELREFAQGQLKLNEKNNGMHVYLEKIINLSKKLGHKVTIVVSPYNKEFRTLFPQKETIFSELNKIANQFSISVLNLFDDEEFIENDFRNIDHLNRSGAKRLTNKIKDKIK